MQLTGNSQIRTIVVLQLGVSLILGIVLLAFGKTIAWSGLLGGLIAAFGNGFFAYRSFVHYRAQEPNKIVARMYGAEIQKWIMTGLLFGLTIVIFRSVSIGVLLGCYLFVQVAVPMAVLLFNRQDK
jgi:F0F1-type ATP synthase assembly protein I